MSLYAFQHSMARTLPRAVAAQGIRPASVVLADKLGSRFLATQRVAKKPIRDEDLMSKTHSDAFDESDALEAGKNPVVTSVEGWGSSPFRQFFSQNHFFPRDPFLQDPFFGDHFAVSPLFCHNPWRHMQPLLRGFPTSDLKVELDNDGTLLHLSGKKKTKQSSIEFHQRLSVGSLDASKMTANVSDGVLVVSAPKLPHARKAQMKTVPITEEPRVISDEEIAQKSYSDAFDESDWAEVGKLGLSNA
ncbi:hypothetical protein ACHAXT_010053 [Thalassiosira profunda]